MKAFSLIVLLSLSMAHAGEFDEIVAQDYRAKRAAAGERIVAEYAANAALTGNVLRAYISREGGDPSQGSCRTSSGYSCDGTLCTPYISSSMNITELGAPGHSFRSCDFSLPGDRACKAEYPECGRIWDKSQRARCDRATLAVLCVNRSTREQTADYIEGTPARGTRRSR